MVPEKEDIEFQLELLKIQLDIEYRRSWFLALFGVIISIIITAKEFTPLISIVAPILIGSTLIFISYNWKEKRLFDIKNKYLNSERTAR